jgi:hypothetical protein
VASSYVDRTDNAAIDLWREERCQLNKSSDIYSPTERRIQPLF